MVRCKSFLYGAHNGNVTNCDRLKKWLTSEGHAVLSDNDGEMVVHTIEHYFQLELAARPEAARGEREERRAAMRAAILRAAGRLEGSYAAVVVDPEAPRSGRAASHIFFGATVRYADAAGAEREVSIVGIDEVDLDRHHISWISPLARALMKAGVGDTVVLQAPGSTQRLQILDVRYESIAVEPFTEPPGAESAGKFGSAR